MARRKLTKQEVVGFAQSIQSLLTNLQSHDMTLNGPQYQSFMNTVIKSFSLKKFITRIHYFNELLTPVFKADKNRSVLEIGSGYGLNLIILKFLGFEKVVGIELVESIAHNAQILMREAQQHLDFSLDNCVTICGNAESTSFKDGMFDCVIACEVISHVPSFDRVMRETNRILTHNGFFVVSDGNNHSCLRLKRRRHKAWRSVRSSELHKRVMFLKEHFPDIDPQFRASIALHTELLPLCEVERIVPDIIKTNKLPMNLYFEEYAPVFSSSGIWVEYGFYPAKLCKTFALYGFTSTLKAYIGSARGFPFNTVQTILNWLPNKLRFMFWPVFIMYAKKTAPPKYLIPDK